MSKSPLLLEFDKHSVKRVAQAQQRISVTKKPDDPTDFSIQGRCRFMQRNQVSEGAPTQAYVKQ